MIVMKQYYVVMRRYEGEMYIFIYTFDEAKKNNWIDENGNRIWVLPPEEEKSPTYVFGFDILDMAIDFYTTLERNTLDKVYTM